jgi:hypothetical protein
MNFFESNIFWFIEGLFACVSIIAFRMWAQDREIRKMSEVISVIDCTVQNALTSGIPNTAVWAVGFALRRVRILESRTGCIEQH